MINNCAEHDSPVANSPVANPHFPCAVLKRVPVFP